MTVFTDPIVEISLDGEWVDITEWTRPDKKIVINRGRSDEASNVDPGSCRLTVDNLDGRFSPRNPNGPWYGLIGRNTPIRISATYEGTTYVRFVGEVSAWPQRWNVPQNEVLTPIQAAGILRRLGQGQRPLRSPMYRQTMSLEYGAPVAYWPMEDGSDAESLASATGGMPLSILPGVSVAAYSGFPGSEPVPTMGSGYLAGDVPFYAATGELQVRWLQHVPADGMGGNDPLSIVTIFTEGRPHAWRVRHAGGNDLQVNGYDHSGTGVYTSGNLVQFTPNGRNLRMSLELTQAGGQVDWTLASLTPDGRRNSAAGSVAGTVSIASRVRVAPSGLLGSTAVGHLSVHDQITSIFDLGNALAGFRGEAAGRRVERLCGEEDVPFIYVGSLDDTSPVGTQASDTLLNLLQAAAGVDGGILYETRGDIGLTYRTRTSLYNVVEPAAPTPPPSTGGGTGGGVDVTATTACSGIAWYTEVPVPPHQVGDLLLLAVRSAVDDAAPTCDGWTVRETVVDDPGNGDGVTAVLTRTASGEPDSYTVYIGGSWPAAAAAVMLATSGVTGVDTSGQDAPTGLRTSVAGVDLGAASTDYAVQVVGSTLDTWDGTLYSLSADSWDRLAFASSTVSEAVPSLLVLGATGGTAPPTITSGDTALSWALAAVSLPVAA